MDLLKKIILTFLKSRELNIYLTKSQIILFKINRSFNFLGYSFVYVKFIRSKLPRNDKLNCRGENPLKLFVYPCKIAIKFFKACFKSILIKNKNVFVFKVINSLSLKVRS